MPKRTITRIALRAFTWLLIGVVALGFSGSFFPPGDSAVVIRPLAGILLLPLAAALFAVTARRAALAALASAVLAFGSLAPAYVASGPRCEVNCLTLYQKNLLSRAWPRYPLADDIIASGAEVVTLQEVSDHNRTYMAKMFDHYPTVITCAFRPRQDVVLLTSLPVVEGSRFCLLDSGLAGARVIAPDGQPIWVLSLHLEWPSPNAQSKQARSIADKIATLEGPIVIAGDFNMVPWGASARRIRDASETHPLGPTRNSYRMGGWLLPLPIDQVLVPDGASGRVERRPYSGSDHEGRLARISLP